MDAVKPEAATAIWKDLVKDVVDRERIDLSLIGYDVTNFYTFLDTFNTRCCLAARSKNKQGRDNLRQVSYALFCAADGQLPLFFDVYEGKRNDARQFSLALAGWCAASAIRRCAESVVAALAPGAHDPDGIVPNRILPT
jgi:hypothetical protein